MILKHSIFFNLALIIILFVSSYSCGPKKAVDNLASTEAQMNKTAIISGKILHREIYPNTKEIKLIMPDFHGNVTTLLAKINETGEFKFEFFPIVKREIKLLPVVNDLVISPGDSMLIVADCKDIGNVTISGDGALLNSQICKFGKFFLQGYNSDYQMPNMEFKKYCNTEREKYYVKLKELKQSERLTTEFELWIRNKIELDYSIALYNYPIRHYARTKEALTDSADFYSFVQDVPKFFDRTIVVFENFKISEPLTWLGHREIRNKYLKEIEQKDTSVNSLIEKEMVLKTDTTYLSQFKLATFFANNLSSNTTAAFDRNRAALDKKITNPFLKNTLTNYAERVRSYNQNPKIFSDELLGNSNNAEINKLISVNQKTGKNLVKEIIENNPNKVLYIDIWASWCQPCIIAMPYSKQLMKDFAGRDVEFIYINILDRVGSWQKTIKELGIEGKHFYCNEAETIAIRKRFNSPGVPFYLLTNKKGVIVDYGYHVVPQNEYTKQAIERLLNE